MKLKFKIQPFQTAAVNAVADIFRGQEKKNSTFTITQESQMSLIDNGYGVGNLLTLTDKQILSNMRDVQKRNNLPITNDVWKKTIPTFRSPIQFPTSNGNDS